MLVVPTPVQGEGAAEEIAAAIATVNRLPLAIDCLVVTRGGGSLEDLWAFNEEAVVRAIHASRIPVISAIGHEIDVTLADLVADVRALTPSEAAELVAPAADELVGRIRQIRKAAGCGAALAPGRGRVAAGRGRPASCVSPPAGQIEDLARRLDELDVRGPRAARQPPAAGPAAGRAARRSAGIAQSAGRARPRLQPDAADRRRPHRPRRGGIGRRRTHHHTACPGADNQPGRGGTRIVIGAGSVAHARDRYSPVRVSTLMTSPWERYSGTCTTRPVCSVAGLLRAVAEAPLMPGSHCDHLQLHRDRQLDAHALVVVDQRLNAFQSSVRYLLSSTRSSLGSEYWL